MIGMTVCSGIGAPEVAAPWIDWRYQSEIEPFPCAVLRARFPDAVNLGDMSKFQEWPDAAIDVLVGGTPCQSFSVGGLRKGLDDPRGNLMLTFLAIAERYAPRWIVWENVPGVLSSNSGRDFGSFLGGLGQLGYGWAYRVLDAQYVRTPGFAYAVPQRRRRVFVVGYLGNWSRAAAVLFESEGLQGHPAPRREAGKVAPTIPSRSAAGGGLGTDFDCDGGLIAESAAALTTRTGSALSVYDAEGGNMICQPAQAFDPGFGVCGALSDGAHMGGGLNGQDAYTGRVLPVAIQERAVSENPDAGPDGAGYRQDGASYTLEARTVPQAVAFSSKDYGGDAMHGVCPTLRAGGHDGSHANAGVPPAVAFDLNQITGPANRSQPDPAVHHTLPASTCPPHLCSPWAVRRLTPTECERLQGFPDGWTQISYRKKPAEKCPDGPRYKALGNSWAVNCGEFIFDRIKALEAMT